MADWSIYYRAETTSRLGPGAASPFGVHSVHSVAFMRRINPDGNLTSSCPECLNVVATGATEIVLDVAEHLHICNFLKLSDSVPPSYLTLTERVLMFLNVHNA
jgi:hypothetical protein